MTTTIEAAMGSAGKAARRAEAAMHLANARRYESLAAWLVDENVALDRPPYLRRLADAYRALASVIEEDT